MISYFMTVMTSYSDYKATNGSMNGELEMMWKAMATMA
jgi:hypothetical protein